MFSHFHFLSSFLIFLLLISSKYNATTFSTAALQEHQHEEFSLGAILDYNSPAGKEEKVAIKMAMDDFFPPVSLHRSTLQLKKSRGEPVQAASSGEST